MLKIKKAKINGFHSSKKKIEFEFASDNITIMFGDNGCGKTTLLQILNAVFAKDDEVLLNHKVNTIDIVFEQDDMEKDVTISQVHEETIYQRNNARLMRILYYDWTQLDNLGLQRTLLLGVDRVNIVTAIQPSVVYNFINMNKTGMQIFESCDNMTKRKFSEQLSEYINFSRKRQLRRTEIDFSSDQLVLNGNNMDVEYIETVIVSRFINTVNKASNNIQSALFLSLSQVINSKKKRDKEKELEFVNSQLEKFLPLISYAIREIPEDKGINEILQLIRQEKASVILDECSDNDLVCLILFNIITSIEDEWETFNSIEQLKNCFNEYTRKDKCMKIDKAGITFEIYDEDEQTIGKHKVDSLSSGEKQLLILLTCLFIDGRKRNFIFIDEPDLSLNMKWQRELVELFKKYCPDTQVIMATHSPSIAEKCTECLRKLV